jgi:hypothetical protein
MSGVILEKSHRGGFARNRDTLMAYCGGLAMASMGAQRGLIGEAASTIGSNCIEELRTMGALVQPLFPGWRPGNPSDLSSIAQ